MLSWAVECGKEMNQSRVLRKAAGRLELALPAKVKLVKEAQEACL